MANSTREPTDEQYLEFIEIMQGIRLALSHLGTGRPPGSASRGALELVAGVISDGDSSLAEQLVDGLGSISHQLYGLREVWLSQLPATARYRVQQPGPLAEADESVREFVSDWFELTGDPGDLVPRRVMNERYSSWCERNLISSEDRVTTSVLRWSLSQLGVGLGRGYTDATDGGAQYHAFVGIRRRTGA